MNDSRFKEIRAMSIEEWNKLTFREQSEYKFHVRIPTAEDHEKRRRAREDKEIYRRRSEG